MTSRSSRSTVLVCEDEVLVRMLMVDLLDESGFKTFEVSDAKEAIALLEARSDIHVLLTDVNMPGLDGFALARHVREHWPNISILISSGRVRPTGDEVPEGAEFIAKPWSEVLEVIRGELHPGLSLPWAVSLERACGQRRLTAALQDLAASAPSHA